MTVDNIPSITNTTSDESIKSAYKALPTSRKKGGSENVQDTGVQLASAVSSVEISETGKQIGEIHQDLERIDDPVKKRQAFNGLEEVRSHLADDGASKMEKFLVKADELKAEDEAAFHEMFSTVGKLAGADEDVQAWVETYNEIEDTETKKQFMKDTERYLDTEIKGGDIKAEVLDRYISNIDHPDEAAAVEARAEQGKSDEEEDKTVRDVEEMKEFLGTFEGSPDSDEESVD
jgi:hypothetical protein